MRQAIVKAAFALAVPVFLSVPALASGVDPALLALVPPDVQTLAGLQLSQAQATPLGQLLIAQIQPDPATAKAMAAAGFDPQRDLREVVAAFGAGFGNMVLFGRGSFHPDRIAAAAVSAGAALSTYRGVALIEARAAAGQGRGIGSSAIASSGALAFLDASTMLAGDAASVKAALDRHSAGAAFSGSLADSARQVAASNDAWFVAHGPVALAPGSASGLGAQLGPLGNVLQAALQLSAGLKLAATQVIVSADVLTRSPQDAQAMADVLKFAVGMLQANPPPGSPAPGSSFTTPPQISSSGSAMHMVVSLPERELEQFFRPRASQPPRRLAAR